jgi:hypothetical protein
MEVLVLAVGLVSVEVVAAALVLVLLSVQALAAQA